MLVNKSTLLFLFTNAIRVLSIVAICLAFSAEIVTMVRNIEGVKAAASPSNSSSPAPSSSVTITPTSRLITSAPVATQTLDMVSLSSDTPLQTRSTASSPLSTSDISITNDERRMLRRRKREVSAMVNGIGLVSIDSDSPSSASPTAAPQPEKAEYIQGTDVPSQAGGILFATLLRIFECIILILCFLSECPPPWSFLKRFWEYAFPPFGTKFGVGVLGVVQIWVGGSMLSHASSGFPLIAGWLLFVVGLLNIILGLALSASVRTIRSIITYDEPPSKSAMILVGNAAPMGMAAETRPQRNEKGLGSGLRGVNISAPIMQEHPPRY